VRRTYRVLALAVVVTGLVATTPAGAVVIAPTYLENVNLGSLVAPALTTTFMTLDTSGQLGGSPPAAVASVTGSVYLNSGIYTYQYAITPFVNNPEEWNTGFNVLGFKSIAGWSLADAVAAGAQSNQFLADGTANPWWAGRAFVINHESDGTVDMNVRSSFSTTAPFDFWLNWPGATSLSPPGPPGPTIRFFFQSDLPASVGAFNFFNSHVGRTDNYAPALPVPVPVPEPSSLLLFGSGLVGLALWARRRFEPGGALRGGRPLQGAPHLSPVPQR